MKFSACPFCAFDDSGVLASSFTIAVTLPGAQSKLEVRKQLTTTPAGASG